jgi:hypothetical protein
MHATDRSGRTPRLVALLACLLIGIRFAASIVCSTCFHRLGAGERRGPSISIAGGIVIAVPPWAELRPACGFVWACSVNEDESAFVLPEIPRLPVVVSIFVPLVFLLISYRSLIPDYGQWPRSSPQRLLAQYLTPSQRNTSRHRLSPGPCLCRGAHILRYERARSARRLSPFPRRPGRGFESRSAGAMSACYCRMPAGVNREESLVMKSVESVQEVHRPCRSLGPVGRIAAACAMHDDIHGLYRAA